MQEKEAEDDKQAQVTRTVQRKSKNPKNNNRNYDEENRNFGVKNEVDLVLQKIAGLKEYGKDDHQKASGMFNRNLIKYSEDLKQMKQKKAEKYLTVNSLLDHPYFLNINNADISTVIDEYEALLNGEGNFPDF